MRELPTEDVTWLLHDGPLPGFFDGPVPPQGYIPLATENGTPNEARWLTADDLAAYARDAHNLIDVLGPYANIFTPWVTAFDHDPSQEPGIRFFAMIDNGRKNGQFRPQ